MDAELRPLADLSLIKALSESTQKSCLALTWMAC
jgi:hypothetical protein